MVIVDMTIGRAGHSSNILEMVDNTASLYGFDRDPAALSYWEQKLSHYSQSHKLFHSKFSQAIPTLKEYGLELDKSSRELKTQLDLFNDFYIKHSKKLSNVLFKSKLFLSAS